MSAKAEHAERDVSSATTEDHDVRRHPTYTFRLSIDDMSLRTLPIADLPINIPGTASSTVPSVHDTADGRASGGTWRTPFSLPASPGRLDDRRLSAMTTETEDGSFFTPRGSMRSWIQGLGEDHAAAAEEVVVIWHTPRATSASTSPPAALTPADETHIPAEGEGDTTLVEPEVSALPVWEWKHRLASDTVRSDDATPLPSRILYILHPPATPRTPSGDAPSSPVQALDILKQTRDQAESAFWRMFMPPLAGLTHMAQSLSETISSLADYVTLSVYSFVSAEEAKESLHRPARTYACETVYTLRMPVPAEELETKLDLENTVRPIVVRKRAGMPMWNDESGGMMEAWDLRGMRV